MLSICAMKPPCEPATGCRIVRSTVRVRRHGLPQSTCHGSRKTGHALRRNVTNELPTDPRLPAVRLARCRVAAAACALCRPLARDFRLRCSTPASASRAKSTRRSTAWSTPQEPRFDGEKVHPAAGHATTRARPMSSPACWRPRRTTRSAACSCRAWSRWRPTASSRWPAVSIGGGGMLTSGNANLLMVHGTPTAAAGVRAQRIRGPLVCGTMCLSEPQAGSSLSRHRHARRARRRPTSQARPARPALPADAATRCGSRPASTS